VGRHRHVTCVRSDGLSTVLASLLEDRRVVAATLVDLGSGFLLDACSRDPDLGDLELLGAGHADLARAAPALTAERPGAGVNLTVETDDGHVHLLRDIPDPHGDALVLAVVLVAGNARSIARTRQRMAAVPVEALTAGPTLQRRPVDGRWQVEPAEPDVPAVPPEGLPGLEPVVPTAYAGPREPVDPVTGEPAPPPAMVPVVVTSTTDRARWAGTTDPVVGPERGPTTFADAAREPAAADDDAGWELPGARGAPAAADV
jgi:hypothetical protein